MPRGVLRQRIEKFDERISHIAQIVVHGDADRVVPVAGSRLMVNALKTAGVRIRYNEVPNEGTWMWSVPISKTFSISSTNLPQRTEKSHDDLRR